MNESKAEDLRIFVSHAVADREPARRLSGVMARQRGVRIFDPTEMLSAGGDWQSKLKDELTASDVFVALMSPAAMQSASVLQEIGAAWALDKPVVLVLKDVSEQSDVLRDWPDQFMVDLDELDDPEIMNQVLRHHRETAGLDAQA